MIVCLCMHVTDSEIKNLAATTLEEVQQKTHAGTGCGCCLEHVEALVAVNNEYPLGATHEHQRTLRITTE